MKHTVHRSKSKVASGSDIEPLVVGIVTLLITIYLAQHYNIFH